MKKLRLMIECEIENLMKSHKEISKNKGHLSQEYVQMQLYVINGKVAAYRDVLTKIDSESN